MAAAEGYRFGQHVLQASVVFFRSKLSFGFVNRKPVVPGHMLVAPLRLVERFCDLTDDEVSDLFVSTRRIAQVVEKQFEASSLTLAVQDGPEAGQTVQHVHVHILPRRQGDFSDNDDVYKTLEKHDKTTELSKESRRSARDANESQSGFRSVEEMAKEAAEMAQFFNN